MYPVLKYQLSVNRGRRSLACHPSPAAGHRSHAEIGAVCLREAAGLERVWAGPVNDDVTLPQVLEANRSLLSFPTQHGSSSTPPKLSRHRDSPMRPQTTVTIPTRAAAALCLTRAWHARLGSALSVEELLRDAGARRQRPHAH